MKRCPEEPQFVPMVGGGSLKGNARLARDLKTLGIRATFVGKYHPDPKSKGFWSSKKVVYEVLTDDVQKARSLGMTVLNRRQK